MNIIAVSQVKYSFTLPRWSISFVAIRRATPSRIKKSPILTPG
jgi:hypothetical protein